MQTELHRVLVPLSSLEVATEVALSEPMPLQQRAVAPSSKLRSLAWNEPDVVRLLKAWRKAID